MLSSWLADRGGTAGAELLAWLTLGLVTVVDMELLMAGFLG